MSNPRAIAAVTLTLKRIIAAAVNDAGTMISTRSPDRARLVTTGLQLNLFLYSINTDGAWGNRDYPGGRPPLPLVLHYLLTAYPPDEAPSDDSATADTHTLLGAAMRALHDHRVLDRAEIAAVPVDGNDLHLQADSVRLSPHNLSTEELSKLWGTMQTPYRTSVAYEARVVLIESAREVSSPVPVLRLETSVIPAMTAPFPYLSSAEGPSGRAIAVPGDTVVLRGSKLIAATATVKLTHQRLTDPLLIPGAGNATEVTFSLPYGMPAGVWGVSLSLQDPSQPKRVTTTVALAVAPGFASPLLPVTLNAAGDAVIPVDCTPPIRPGQRVALIVGQRQIAHATPESAAVTALEFTVPKALPGKYLARLRVDGVDSLHIDYSTAPPAFLGTTVTVQP